MNAFIQSLLQDSQFTIEVKWDLVRTQRNALLASCDWTQLPDVSLTLEEKQAWAAYRQQLRDITESFTWPDDVIFPPPPGEPS